MNRDWIPTDWIGRPLRDEVQLGWWDLSPDERACMISLDRGENWERCGTLTRVSRTIFAWEPYSCGARALIESDWAPEIGVQRPEEDVVRELLGDLGLFEPDPDREAADQALLDDYLAGMESGLYGQLCGGKPLVAAASRSDLNALKNAFRDHDRQQETFRRLRGPW